MVDLPASGAPIPGRPDSGDHLSRRSLIAVGVASVAGLVASACSASNPVSDDKTPKSPAGLAPDVAVATSALAEIRAVLTAVDNTLSRFPEVRARLVPLGQMHQAHEKSLANAVPARAQPAATPAPYVVPRKREVALGNLATREQRLHDTLDALALRAQSGDFARLLASMGSAVAQQLAVWQP